MFLYLFHRYCKFYITLFYWGTVLGKINIGSYISVRDLDITWPLFLVMKTWNSPKVKGYTQKSYTTFDSVLPCNEKSGPSGPLNFSHPNLVWEDQIWLPKLVCMAQPKMVRSGKLIEFMRTWCKWCDNTFYECVDS